MVTDKLDLIFAVSNFCSDLLCKLYLNTTKSVCDTLKQKKEIKKKKGKERNSNPWSSQKGESFDKIHVIVF